MSGTNTTEKKEGQSTKFQHRFGYYSEALGISDERRDEIKEHIRDLVMNKKNASLTTSEKTERLLSAGYNFEEACFAMYAFSKLESLGSKLSTLHDNPIMGMFSSMFKELNTDEDSGISVGVNFGKIFDDAFDKVNRNM